MLFDKDGKPIDPKVKKKKLTTGIGGFISRKARFKMTGTF